MNASIPRPHQPQATRTLKPQSRLPNNMHELSDHFKSVLIDQQLDLLPHLAVCMWLILFLAKPKNIDYMDSFLSFYKKAKGHPNVLKFLRQYGREIYPMMTILLEAIESGSERAMVDVCKLITLYGDRESLVALENRVEQVLESLPSEQIKLVRCFGLPALTDVAERSQLEHILEELLGVRAEYLPRLFPFAPNRPGLQEIMLEIEQLIAIFAQIHIDLEANISLEDLSQRVRNLSWVRWPVDDRVLSQCTSVVLHSLAILEAHPGDDVETIASLLFLKLYDFGLPTKEFVVPVLRGLGKIPTNTRRFFLGRPNPDLFNLELTDLINYLSDAEEEVQQGAIRLMMLIVENFYSYSASGHAEQVFKVDLDPRTIRHLIDSPNHLVKNLGISILPFSFNTFSIQGEGKELLTKILDCHENQEAQAWSRFIHYMPVLEGSDHLTEWKIFFESLLEKELQVLPSVRKAALSQYNKLVVSQDDANVINEQKLELPLARDN